MVDSKVADDVAKAKAAGKAALADVNTAEGWIDAHPRLAAGACLVLGGFLVQVAHWVHLLK